MNQTNEAGSRPSDGFRDVVNALVPLIGNEPSEKSIVRSYRFREGFPAPPDETCAKRVRAELCPINNAIAEELSLLGADGKEAILYYLHKMGMTKERTPFEPEELECALRGIFADGSRVLKAGMVTGVRAVSRSPTNETRCVRCAVAWLGDLPSEEVEVVMGCVEKAFDVMGRTGKEVFFEILRSRYGVTKGDIIDSPGAFTSALKVMLDGSAEVLERYALYELNQRLGVKASSLEESISFLKRRSRHGEGSRGEFRLSDPVTADAVETNSLVAPLIMEQRSRGAKANDRFAYRYSTGD